MSGRNTRSRRGRDSPEEHQEGDGAEEEHPNEEEDLEIALDEAEQVGEPEELELEPVIPVMADGNGVIDAINNGVTQITAAIAQAANNVQCSTTTTSDTILPVVSLFSLRSNNSTT